jgi:predicted DNA-binding protein (UPF0251 family)
VTAKQTEALRLYAEHQGNVTAAAKAAGTSRQALQRRLDRANKKLGRNAIKALKTTRLPEDRRGQPTVADRADEE